MNDEITEILKHFGFLIAPEREYDIVKWVKVPDGTWEYYYLDDYSPYDDQKTNVVYLKEYANKESGATIRMATGYCWLVYCNFVVPENKKTT